MVVIENLGIIEGDATSASEVDYTIYGLDNNVLTFLANGQLASSKGTIYTANSTDVITSIILTNTGAAHNHVNLYIKPTGGTSRRLISKDLQLEVGYSLYFDGKSVVVLDINGGVVAGTNVDNTPYAASWDNVTTIAPSKNAVYDQMQLQMLKTGSNLAIGSDADGDMYYRASSVLARLAKGAADLKLFMNAAGTAPEWERGITKADYAYALGTPSGTQTLAGAGFTPSMAIVIYGINLQIAGIGFSNGTNHFTMLPMSSGVVSGYSSATHFIMAYPAGGSSIATLAMNTDGGELTWTYTPTSTGTLNFSVIWFR